jgi:predicted 3-demethylubiquinone-9 3-methyltransferase (glyoxalase superfamily)
MRMPAQDGKRLMHVHLKINGGSVMMNDDFPEYRGGPSGEPASVTLHLQVDDADRWFERAVAAGADDQPAARQPILGRPLRPGEGPVRPQLVDRRAGHERLTGDTRRDEMSKLTTCLWSNYTAEEQAEFYTALVPNSRILKVHRTPADTPSQKAGDVITAEIELDGRQFMLLNGGPIFTHSEAVSFVISTDGPGGDRPAVGRDRRRRRAGEPVRLVQGQWGVSWQITPRQLINLVFANPDPAGAKRAMEAMMQMQKIDIAAIERAAAGETVQA